MKKLSFIFIATFSICTLYPHSRADVIFSDDFSESTLDDDKPNGYVGGYYTTEVPFNQWVSGSNGEITDDETLKITNTSGKRSAVIVLHPDLFTATGAGSYTLSYDIVDYTGNTNNNAAVSIWSGSGYGEPDEHTANALNPDTNNNELDTAGNATASMLSYATHQSTGTDFTLSFNWDGISAIAIFMGSETSGYPFPIVEYDNLVIAVPEPGSLILVALSLMGGLLVFSFNKKQ